MIAGVWAPARWKVCVAALLASGCFLDRAPLEGPLDAGGRARDAQPREEDGGSDAGSPSEDAGPPDAGPPDAGPPDSGPPVVPLTVTSGLLVHFDARRVAGDAMPTSSSPPTWVDLTGGNDATCNNVRLEAEGIGPGRPSMRTNGTSLSKCVFPIPDFGDLSVFIVLRTTDTTTGPAWWQSPVILGGDTAGTVRDAALFASAGYVGFARRDSTFQSALHVADGAPHVLSLVRVRASGETTIRLDTDGVETATIDPSGHIQDPDTWWLASHGIEGNGGLAAAYGEVLIYTRALSPGEVDEVDRYLRARWL